MDCKTKTNSNLESAQNLCTILKYELITYLSQQISPRQQCKEAKETETRVHHKILEAANIDINQLQLGLILTLLIPHSSIGHKQTKIAGSRRNHMELEQSHDRHLTRHLRVRVERQDPGQEVRVRLRVRHEPIRQQGERHVHLLRLVGRYLARGDRDLPDLLPPVVQQSGAVPVLEAGLVGVLDGEVDV